MSDAEPDTDTSTDTADPDPYAGTRLHQCDDCGAVMANRGGHRCTSTTRDWLTSKPNRRVIAVMQEYDDNPLDATVVHTSGDRSRAYHATGDDPTEPKHARCRAALEKKDTHWVPTDRADAIDAERFPCTQCHDLPLEEIEARLESKGLVR